MIKQLVDIELSNVLVEIAKSIDLDATRYKDAISKYEAIANWLNAENSTLNIYSPQIFPQGSFLLGTVVKSLLIEEDYDIDLVCLMSEIDSHTSPAYVKRIVGDRLKENDNYKYKLEEKNRCWRIDYAGDFHLDIIPCIMDTEKGGDSILIPDSALHEWTCSDPKGYTNWFKDKMQVQFASLLKSYAEKHDKDVEDVPEFLIKTPLQQAVQLMKRHRDIQFIDDSDNKPISIIITTLAGSAYMNQDNLYEVLKYLAVEMANYIYDVDGEAWIPNPVNQDENFADKWNEFPERRKNFYRWTDKLKDDLQQLENYSSITECEETLRGMFGDRISAAMIEGSKQVAKIISPESRFDVPHKEKSVWDLRISGKVTVRGFIKYSENNHVEFSSDSEPLDKKLSIYFLARTENIYRPYKIQWQVVNTGQEAAAVEGGLRGKFYKSVENNSHKREESTDYKGMHWIEAFIIKGGFCIARSGEFVVNIK